MTVQDDNRNNKGSGYVPPNDDNGVRQTFTTPELPETRGNSSIGKVKYPFATIRAGESFPIMFSEMNEKSVHPYVSRMRKKYQKNFKVTKFVEHNCYLISCMSMSQEQAIQSSTNIVDALRKIGDKAG